MDKFPHLNFAQKIQGKPRFTGGGNPNAKSEYNKNNRPVHSAKLSGNTSNIKTNWSKSFTTRSNENLAEINEEVVPVFLQLNPELIIHDFDLKSFGIEIISEEDDGFIIGASLDGLKSLEEKINGFINEEYGSGKIADLWQIIDGNREEWKPKHILSDELFEKWDDIQDDIEYELEVSIAFDRPMGKEPDPSKQGGQKRLEKYRSALIERDDLLIERENNFGAFINHYGEITSSFIGLEDSFACEVKISGKGLKDLVFNYPFVFEVSEVEEVGGIDGSQETSLIGEFQILPPKENEIEIGVIDSGIMENHILIQPAIKSRNSKSYIADTSTSDYVKGGGHGTKVAGAILYPKGVSSIEQPYQLPFFIRNLRVLNKDNLLLNRFPAELMIKIVEENKDCKIFNLSINSKSPFRKKHMSSWAATLDTLIHEHKVLFVISAGNISTEYIMDHHPSGNNYPSYLNTPFCKIANPGQSSFGIVVGSINHVSYEDENWISLGLEDDISPFSRVGTGIWGKIKPDLVEYGGGLAISKNGLNSVREIEEISPELVRSTLHGGSAIGKGSSGTSFAAPKISHIAGQLLKLYPEEGINLIRALLVHGARLPGDQFVSPTSQSIEHYGYGFPSIERSTNNKENRITFYNSGNIKAEEGHIYSLLIPEELRNQEHEYDILIEVSLAFTSRVRRTRQKTKSYLGTWLDWTNSKIGESYEDFRDYALKKIEETETTYDNKVRNGLENFNWKIKRRIDSGNVKGINRNYSTVQKDWAIIKSFQLPKEISFAVRAHNGWDKNKQKIPYSIVVSLEVLGESISIYESIRNENAIEISIST